MQFHFLTIFILKMFHIKSSSDYLKHCDEADKNPQKFWREIAENFHKELMLKKYKEL